MYMNDNKDKNEKFPQKGNFSASPNNRDIPINNNEINRLANANYVDQKVPSSNNQLNQGTRIGNNLSQQNKINQAKKSILKQGAKTVANTVAGPVGGKVVDEISKTLADQNTLNKTSKKTKNQFNKKSLFGFNNKKTDENNEEISGNAKFNVDISKKIMLFFSAGIFSISGCFTTIVIVSIICLIVTPLFYINEIINKVSDTISDFGERLGNLLTFRGWCSDEECQEKEKNNFYEEVDRIYGDYKEHPYYITLNYNLITATLTYSNPFLTEEEENPTGIEDYINDLQSSNFTDFKKSKEKVKLLAENMVSYCCYKNGKEYLTDDGQHMCRSSNGKEYEGITFNCPDDIIDEETEEIIVDYDKRYKLDIEHYREYLEDEFIKKFYFDNVDNQDVDSNVRRIVEEIFLRVSAYEDYQQNNYGSSNYFTANNSTVIVLDCNNNMVIDEMSLYEYLQGVLYVEGYATNRSEEFLKVMAVAAKNYLYAANSATVDNIPTQLRIKSCAMFQIYCSVTEGCHNMNDGIINDNYNTIATGPDSDGGYYMAPLIDDLETMEKIKNAIDATFTEFIVDEGQFVATQYRASCTETCDSSNNIMDQTKAYEMIQNGSTYKEVLDYFYTGTLDQVSLVVGGYPLDLDNVRVTSPFGWRVHPTEKVCKIHTGIDIGADAYDNIYAFANGVVTFNAYSNGYGNYTVIGHGEMDENGIYEYYTAYAHQIQLSRYVNVGDEVVAGQIIGNVGSSGTSTGNHLHFEVYKIINGKKEYENPLNYFPNIQLIGELNAPYQSLGECNNR